VLFVDTLFIVGLGRGVYESVFLQTSYRQLNYQKVRFSALNQTCAFLP